MCELFFGGPDRPARFLRDLLEEHVANVPSGGQIDWATYYFRDRRLARALIDASDRGVNVNLRLEGRPRRASANEDVIAMLRSHGLGGGLHIHQPPQLPLMKRPYLHAKIYSFSHPEPVALIGSFNPSGDEPDDPEVTADIGDQDRGHNLLAAYRDPAIVQMLQRHVRKLGGVTDRFRPHRTGVFGDTSFFFYPRLRTGIIDRELARLGKGSKVSGAISHLKEGRLASQLASAADRGVTVRLLVHDTERRVPEAAIAGLRSAGVSVTRYARPDALPLHCKFLLVETPEDRVAWLGSFNFNSRSRRWNHELLVRSADQGLWEALDCRYQGIAAEFAE